MVFLFNNKGLKNQLATSGKQKVEDIFNLEKMEKTDYIFDLWNGKKKSIEKETSKKIVKKRQIRLYYV